MNIRWRKAFVDHAVRPGNIWYCLHWYFRSCEHLNAWKQTDYAHTETTEERDIGVTVSCNLKPGQQCKKAAHTASVVLGDHASIHYRDRKVFLNLYKQYGMSGRISSSQWRPGLHGPRRTLKHWTKFKTSSEGSDWTKRSDIWRTLGWAQAPEPQVEALWDGHGSDI